MNEYFITEVEFGTPEYHNSITLRDDILRKPLNLQFTPEQLSSEFDSYHLAIYNHELEMVGCLVLKPLSSELIKMRQVAIAEGYQGKGLGRRLVVFSEAYAKTKGFKIMELNARDVAIPFYEKNSYTKVGKPFEEVGIKHYKMEKTL